MDGVALQIRYDRNDAWRFGDARIALACMAGGGFFDINRDFASFMEAASKCIESKSPIFPRPREILLHFSISVVPGDIVAGKIVRQNGRRLKIGIFIMKC